MFRTTLFQFVIFSSTSDGGRWWGVIVMRKVVGEGGGAVLPSTKRNAPRVTTEARNTSAFTGNSLYITCL